MLQEDLTNGYRRVYKIRAIGEDGLNIVVSIPREVIDREARKRHLSIDEFIQKFRAVATYNGFEGIHYTFEPMTE